MLFSLRGRSVARTVGIGLLAVSCLLGCKKPIPEQKAAEAALSYYHRILEGYPDGLLAAKANNDSLSDEHQEQLKKAFHLFVSDMQRKHQGLKSISISPNVGRRDSLQMSDGSWQHITYAFLLLSFNDSTQEEISVPMVESNGDWFLR